MNAITVARWRHTTGAAVSRYTRIQMLRRAPDSPLMSFALRSRALMIEIVIVLSVGW